MTTNEPTTEELAQSLEESATSKSAADYDYLAFAAKRLRELEAEVERLREVNQDLSSKEQTRVLKSMIRTATE